MNPPVVECPTGTDPACKCLLSLFSQAHDNLFEDPAHSRLSSSAVVILIFQFHFECSGSFLPKPIDSIAGRYCLTKIFHLLSAGYPKKYKWAWHNANKSR